jgi:hypothetical protein
MDDLRERRTVPVTVRFQEVDDVEEKVRFLVAGRELVSCPVDNFTYARDLGEDGLRACEVFGAS